MSKPDIAHELWRLEGRTFATDGRRVIACNDGGCLGIARGDDPGTALAIAHVLEAFFKDRQQKAAANVMAAETPHPRLTPGMIDFMRACQSAEPPSYCPSVLIGTGLAEMGLASYQYADNRPAWGQHYGHWILTDAGRSALNDGGEAVHTGQLRDTNKSISTDKTNAG